MNGRTLNDVSSDLESFYQIVLKTKLEQPDLYESLLRQPAWRGKNSPTRKLNQPEDLANAVLGEMGKFKSHVAELQQSTLAITPTTHEQTLVEIAGRCRQHVQTYVDGFKNTNAPLCARLINDLNNIQQMVQQSNRPSPKPF